MDTMWSAILVIMSYIGVAVTLGVLSHRLPWRRLILLSGLFIVAAAVASAWPRLWRSGSELLEYLVQGFYMVVFLETGVFVLAFAAGRCGSRAILGAARAIRGTARQD
jgi:hypothetical protein